MKIGFHLENLDIALPFLIIGIVAFIIRRRIKLPLNQNKMFGKYRKPKPNIVDDYIKSIRNSNYSAGLRVGTQTAIDELRDVQNYECINLTPEEKEKVMSFLIENNLEFGYNAASGGFYVLKRIKSE